MSIQFTCDDKQSLIAYLYGDIEPAARQAVDAHLASCRACAEELTALGEVRSELGLWVPPHAELDFTIVPKSALPAANVLRPARWWNTVPVWAQAAAAVLVLAAGAGIANLQVQSGPDGFVVRTGWMRSDANATSAARGVLAQDTPHDDAWKPALIALEQQLRNEIKSTRDADPRITSRGAADEATVRRVQQLITEAEQRQQRELAARLIDLTRDINMQRRADMQSISRVVGSYDEQLLRQRQMINNVYRVSGTPQQ
jgi:anti-sigma factor ChrR (cupin superfamily)